MKKSIMPRFSRGNEGISYDYSGVYEREDTVAGLLRFAAENKRDITEYWNKMRAYYDGEHGGAALFESFGLENSLPFPVALSSDGYIHVESQIDASLPEFEFSPRSLADGEKAKQREKIVRYICDRNSLEQKNSRNERRLGIYGSAVWKVCWDGAVQSDGVFGEVLVDNPRPEEIFPDPSATTVDDCEYIGYVYSMHKEKARRLFSDELSAHGISFSEVAKNGDIDLFDDADDKFYDSQSRRDTIKICEWWFRQPYDGEADVQVYFDGEPRTVHYSWRAGDIALSVLIGGREVRYIPKYWRDTCCNMFPFVIYNRLPRDRAIWGKSELEAIIPFIDAADREIAFAQFNAAFSSNDIILAEENALCEDSEFDNSPGAVWKLRPGMMGKVQRLTNSAYSESHLHSNYDKWRAIMEETTGNYAMNQGTEPLRVTTATGIALLNERAKNRSALKKIDKSAGFARLFELCDRTALEYYDDGRIIFLGAADEGEMVYRSRAFRETVGDNVYYPSVDVRIHIGDGLANSKAFTVSALSSLISTPITRDNYKIIKSYLELVDLPMRKEINEMLDERFENEEPMGEAVETADINKILDEIGEI